MSSLSSLNRNILRISGLSSGLDTDSIVQSMLTSTRNKVYNQFRAQTRLEWKQDKYKEVNNELRKLKDEFGSVLKQEQNMLSVFNYRKYSVEMATASDSAYASITAGAYAKEGDYTIDYVKQLASGAKTTSLFKMTGTGGQGLSYTDTLGQISAKLEAAGNPGLTFTDSAEGKSLSFSFDGKEYSFTQYATLDSVISTINANSANFKFGYSQLTDGFTLESKATGVDSTLSFANNNFFAALGIWNQASAPAQHQAGQNAMLSINGVHIERASNSFEVDGVSYNLKKTFNPAGGLTSVSQLASDAFATGGDILADPGVKIALADRLDQAIAKMTQARQDDINASIAANGGKLALSFAGADFEFDPTADTIQGMLTALNDSQDGAAIRYDSATGQFVLSAMPGTGADGNAALNDLFASSGDLLSMLGIEQANLVAGKNAQFVIDGKNLDYTTNDFSYMGNVYHLTHTFDAPSDVTNGKSVSFSVDRDVDGTVDLVKKYVDAYNELIEKLNGMVTEKTNRDYGPLHEDEKAAMTEKQIEQWEELAKAGIMRNDSQLQGLIFQMRTSFYVTATGASRTLADIGIGGASATAAQYEGAKIGKMYIDEAKLKQALIDNPDEVFQMFTAKDPDGNLDGMGLVTRVNALIDNYVKFNEQSTQYYNDQAITRAQKRYDDMVQAMWDEEDRLWNRFTALETLMSEMNSQSQWIGNQMMGYSSQ